MRPRLRPDIQILLLEEEGQKSILLEDPDRYGTDFTHLEYGTLDVLRYFDGRHTLEDVKTELVREGAGPVDVERLGEFAGMLDRMYLLDSERYRRQRERREGFLTSDLRRASHAGQAYPAGREAAHRFCQETLSLAEKCEGAPLGRLIAPHIDLGLGAEVYARAHGRLFASGRPDVVVVLGVCHAPAERKFIACRKDFETPCAVVRHDAAFLDRMELALDEDLTEGDLVHLDEHSVEFQALWMAHLWPDDPPRIVPFLLRGFSELIRAGETPSTDPDVERFVGALSGAIAADERRVIVLASVDLAHVGPIYEHPQGLDEEGERELESADRRLLDFVKAGDADGFFGEVAKDENARQVCGVAPIYVTLRLGKGPGRLLRYGQGRIHAESGSVVSFAAVSFAD